MNIQKKEIPKVKEKTSKLKKIVQTTGVIRKKAGISSKKVLVRRTPGKAINYAGIVKRLETNETAEADIAAKKLLRVRLLPHPATGEDQQRRTLPKPITNDRIVENHIAKIIKSVNSNEPAETNLSDLTKIALNICSVFDIRDEDAAQLLGYSPSSRTLISNMRQGKTTLPNKQSAIHRANYLIRLHYSLSDLYDKNLQTCALWLRSGQERLDQKTPINFMIERGEVGMKQVVDWVEKVNGR